MVRFRATHSRPSPLSQLSDALAPHSNPIPVPGALLIAGRPLKRWVHLPGARLYFSCRRQNHRLRLLVGSPASADAGLSSHCPSFSLLTVSRANRPAQSTWPTKYGIRLLHPGVLVSIRLRVIASPRRSSRLVYFGMAWVLLSCLYCPIPMPIPFPSRPPAGPCNVHGPIRTCNTYCIVPPTDNRRGSMTGSHA